MSYIFKISENWEEKLPAAKIITTNKKSKHKEKYYNLACGFDIETTTIFGKYKGDEIRHAYMYIWQFCIEDIVIIGRTWNEFNKLIEGLEKHYNGDAQLLIWIHNMGFEMSFMLPRINDKITDSFYKDRHKPIYVTIDNKIRFQDSLMITGCSLEKTAEIYNLEHKKLTNDLDYSKIRNSKTPLTPVELMYCYHDVLILSDFARKMLDDIIPKNFDKLPLTKTQLFLNKVFHYMTYKEKLHTHDILLSYEDYIDMNRFLFRGGYVHSNFNHTGEILENVQSVDFTSSYPAVMLHNNNYPVGIFRTVNISKLTKKRFRELLNNYACWLDISFYNIKQSTNHTIESRSKIKVIGGDNRFDNGRLSYAEYIQVELTELDFDIYEHFYSWEQMQINSIKISRRGSLPEGLIKALKEDYVIKATLKNQGMKDSIDYLLAKQNINSAYGACCKKIPFYNWTYKGDWCIANEFESENNVYQKWAKKQNILPFQYACWITANARHNLLVDGVSKIGDDCVYCDTDSMKVINYDKHRDVVLLYNNKMKKANEELIKVNPAFADLGEFDENDGFYEKFKTLGAKRYVVIEDNKPHVTIAGLPKNSLISYVDENKKDIMDIFIDDMYLKAGESGKVTTCYNDEKHSDIVIDEFGNSEEMEELSSCALYEIPFNMKISNEYLRFLQRSMNYNNMYLC